MKRGLVYVIGLMMVAGLTGCDWQGVVNEVSESEVGQAASDAVNQADQVRAIASGIEQKMKRVPELAELEGVGAGVQPALAVSFREPQEQSIQVHVLFIEQVEIPVSVYLGEEAQAQEIKLGELEVKDWGYQTGEFGSGESQLDMITLVDATGTTLLQGTFVRQ